MKSNEQPNSLIRQLQSCYMCNNAAVDDELTDENDLSFIQVGKTVSSVFRIMLQSGNSEGVKILFEQFSGKYWQTIGVYAPSFCPNCGRKLVEQRRYSK